MKPSEIRLKEIKEIKRHLTEKKEALFGLKLKLVTGQLAQTSDVKNTKRDIARYLTILREKDQEPKGFKHAKPTKKEN